MTASAALLFPDVFTLSLACSLSFLMQTPILSKILWRLNTRLYFLHTMWRHPLCPGHCGVDPFLHSVVFDSCARNSHSSGFLLCFCQTFTTAQNLTAYTCFSHHFRSSVWTLPDDLICFDYMNFHAIMSNSDMKLFLQVLMKVVNYLGHCSLVAVWFLSSTSQIQDE